jgi:hypothetical protein
MSLYGSRGHDVRRRMHPTGCQHQLAVVAGYAWRPNSLQADIFLACGTMPSGLLRYSGKTVLEFKDVSERRAFAKQVQSLRLAQRHPLLASPIPSRMVPIAPHLLADVSHHGWTAGGLMHGIALEGLHNVEEPPTPKRHGPTIVEEH